MNRTDNVIRPRRTPRCYTRRAMKAPLFLVFLLIAGAVWAADEVDPDWSPDMSTYFPTPQIWPLCGDILHAPTVGWSPGDPCTTSGPDRVVSTYGQRDEGDDVDMHRGIDLRSTYMELDNDYLDDPADPQNPCAHDCIPNFRPVFAVAAGSVDEIEFKCDDGIADGFRIQLVKGDVDTALLSGGETVAENFGLRDSASDGALWLVLPRLPFFYPSAS